MEAYQINFLNDMKKSKCSIHLAPAPFRLENFVLVDFLATIRSHRYYRQAKVDERCTHMIEFVLN